MNKTARIWILQALHDLDMAEKNLTISGYDVAAFLCHQAVEKLLKALIAARGEEIPKIHFLDVLGRRLGLDITVMKEINSLSGDYIIARYPGACEMMPFEQYDFQLAKDKIAVARRVFSCLESEYSVFIEGGKT